MCINVDVCVRCLCTHTRVYTHVYTKGIYWLEEYLHEDMGMIPYPEGVVGRLVKAGVCDFLREIE